MYHYKYFSVTEIGQASGWVQKYLYFKFDSESLLLVDVTWLFDFYENIGQCGQILNGDQEGSPTFFIRL